MPFKESRYKNKIVNFNKIKFLLPTLYLLHVSLILNYLKLRKLALPITHHVEVFLLSNWRRWESNPYPIPFTLALSTVETIPSPYICNLFLIRQLPNLYTIVVARRYNNRPHQPITIGFLKRFFSAFLRIPVFPKFSAVSVLLYRCIGVHRLGSSRKQKRKDLRLPNSFLI